MQILRDGGGRSSGSGGSSSSLIKRINQNFMQVDKPTTQITIL